MKRLHVTASLLTGFLLASLSLSTLAQRPEPLAPDTDEIEVLPVQGNVYMIATGGSNIAVQLGDEGVLLVDAGNVEAADNVIAAIRQLSPNPIRQLINTSILPGHILGNQVIHPAGVGQPIIGMPIIGHTNGLTLLATTALGDDLAYEFWPNSTFFGADRSMFYNGEGIEMTHQPNAITDGDIMVYFRDSDVLVTGDIFDLTQYPRFHPELGGSLQGVIDALNRIIDITIPKYNQQGGTLVIPGHGRIASESDVVEYRDMVTIIRNRVQSMLDEGKSFDEIVAARPALEYDGLYSGRHWTTEMFLEAVYEDLR